LGLTEAAPGKAHKSFNVFLTSNTGCGVVATNLFLMYTHCV